MTTPHQVSRFKCPECQHLHPKPISRTRFKCKGCREWLELNKAGTKLDNHRKRKLTSEFRSHGWKEMVIAKHLPTCGTREAALAAGIQELVAKKKAHVPAKPPTPVLIPKPKALSIVTTDTSPPW